jgi:hypothetical protein
MNLLFGRVRNPKTNIVTNQSLKKKLLSPLLKKAGAK